MIGSKIVYFFIGPFHGATTGQSECLKLAQESVLQGIKISVGGEGLSLPVQMAITLRSLINFSIKLTRFAFMKKVVYITPSRSVVGALRDLPFVFLASTVSSKLVAHWHGADILRFIDRTNPVVRFIYKAMYSGVDEHIVLTESMKDQLQHFNPKAISVIPNCHRREGAYQVDFSKKANDGKLHLLYLSNLIPEKGIIDLLDVMQCLGQNGNRFTLHIVGRMCSSDGEFQSDFNCKAGGSNIIYHGPLYGRKKVEVLEFAHILIFPSYYPTEAFPLVILEAMSYGLAIVAYDHNYIRDFFCYDGGYLVIKRDKEGLRSCVESLASRPEKLRHCMLGNVEASRRYTVKHYMCSISNVLSGS